MTGSSAMRQAACAAAALLLPCWAHAHAGAAEASGFAHGFAHPLGGLDHVAAMVAVGLWAAQRGGRAAWMVPAAFVCAMSAGGLLATLGMPLPFVEPAIVASVLVFGMLVAAAVRLPLAASGLLVASFALFHGHAHGAEMPETVSGLAYGTGFALATALLHAGGIGLARCLAGPRTVRYAGGAVAAVGICLGLA